MAQKKVDVNGIGPVTLSKRRGAKNIRLTIQPDGNVRVSIPFWLPYASAIRFAQARSAWIASNRKIPTGNLKDGNLIGKKYRLKFVLDHKASKTGFRLRDDVIEVTAVGPIEHPETQKIATIASEKALKKEANELLKNRTDELSDIHKLSYFGFKTRKLRSRWGSCSNEGVITLNYYLVQLPWHLIDYVILHELAHTKHHNHGPAFWQLFESILPEARILKKEIKAYQPILLPN